MKKNALIQTHRSNILVWTILLVGVVLSVNLVSAQLVFELYDDIDLKVSCFDTNDIMCDSATACNITVYSPNMSVLVNNQPMTNNGAFFNYTAPNFNKIGEYNAMTICNKAASNGYSSFSFIVGSDYTEAQGNLISTIIFITFGISVFFLVFSKFTDKGGLQLFFVAISFISLISTLMLSVVAIQQMLSASRILASTSALLYVLGIIFGLFMFFIMIKLTIQALDALKSTRGLQ